ncbi:MAG: type II toxin-antitoxin system Phd/YefM family antitoxin, partial [Deltaproteobacteria bacterium]|nr:type II toxin-antitoxin system Phd/YefM family antitoxin [Deltaproteobacteria bacterium]
LETVRRAQRTGQEYVVTARGKPAAVLIGFDEWEVLVETREIKRDKKLMAQIRRSQRYFRRGKGKSHRLLDWS